MKLWRRCGYLFDFWTVKCKCNNLRSEKAAFIRSGYPNRVIINLWLQVLWLSSFSSPTIFSFSTEDINHSLSAVVAPFFSCSPAALRWDTLSILIVSPLVNQIDGGLGEFSRDLWPPFECRIWKFNALNVASPSPSIWRSMPIFLCSIPGRPWDCVSRKWRWIFIAVVRSAVFEPRWWRSSMTYVSSVPAVSATCSSGTCNAYSSLFLNV